MQVEFVEIRFWAQQSAWVDTKSESGGESWKMKRSRPGCITHTRAPLCELQKKKQEDNFICRHLAPRVCGSHTEAGSQKPPPVIFPQLFGATARKGKEATLRSLLDAFQPLGLELPLFQPTCLSASSWAPAAGLTPPPFSSTCTYYCGPAH